MSPKQSGAWETNDLTISWGRHENTQLQLQSRLLQLKKTMPCDSGALMLLQNCSCFVWFLYFFCECHCHSTYYLLSSLSMVTTIVSSVCLGGGVEQHNADSVDGGNHIHGADAMRLRQSSWLSALDGYGKTMNGLAMSPRSSTNNYRRRWSGILTRIETFKSQV